MQNICSAAVKGCPRVIKRNRTARGNRSSIRVDVLIKIISPPSHVSRACLPVLWPPSPLLVSRPRSTRAARGVGGRLNIEQVSAPTPGRRVVCLVTTALLQRYLKARRFISLAFAALGQFGCFCRRGWGIFGARIRSDRPFTM